MKYLSLFIVCISLLSCNSTSKQKSNSAKAVNQKQVILTIDQLMETAEGNIGKQISFRGTVNHVCAHSGKRCILKNAEGNLSIRVEASGKLEGFNREIAGSDLIVKGILCEKRLDTEYINKWESDVKEKVDTENEGEHCNSEMTNIKEMREWMKKNNKDYYAIYFVDGTEYEVVE
nr:hypothetical protein [uncultured Marinifilum sp.]